MKVPMKCHKIENRENEVFSNTNIQCIVKKGEICIIGSNLYLICGKTLWLSDACLPV